MAVDEALLNNFKNNDLPIFRVYKWENTISFGRFSNVFKSIDVKLLKEKQFKYVRRMSGGGILFHGCDVSYSLIMPRNSLNHLGVKKSYHFICRFIIAFYEKLGIQADFAKDSGLDIDKSNICMATNEPYDIIIKDKKIGGNAQRYKKNVLFQHGTIPLDINRRDIQDIFTEDSGLEHITTLKQLKNFISYNSVKDLLIESFKKTFELEFVIDDLNSLEQQSVENLFTKKYCQESWNIDAVARETYSKINFGELR